MTVEEYKQVSHYEDYQSEQEEAIVLSFTPDLTAYAAF